MQVTDRQSPRFLYGCATARHRHICQMGGPFKLFGLGHQHFTAPDGAVRTITGAVKGQTNDRAFQFVFRHAADNVGMMMLDLDFLNTVLLCGKPGTQVVRMHITGNNFRTDFKYALQMVNRQLKKVQGHHIFKIPDMLA